MNRYRYCLTIVAVLLLLSKSALAQNSSTGRETKKADVNFAELAKYYQEYPQPIVRRMPKNEDEEVCGADPIFHEASQSRSRKTRKS